jgi:hypothetical protein
LVAEVDAVADGVGAAGAAETALALVTTAVKAVVVAVVAVVEVVAAAVAGSAEGVGVEGVRQRLVPALPLCLTVGAQLRLLAFPRPRGMATAGRRISHPPDLLRIRP